MKKILIIDDDETFQKTMAAKLGSLTYQVVSASNGKDGLDKVISEKPDLILLDIKMPVLDGMGFLKSLRAQAGAETIPILITSNLADMEKIGEGVSLGVRGYIIKSNETLDTITKQVEGILNS